MRTTVGSVVSWVLLAAVVGWAGWPYLESAGVSPASKTRIAEVVVAQLASVTGIAPARDPFQSLSEAVAAESSRASETTTDPAAKGSGSEPAAGSSDQPGRPSGPAHDPTKQSRREEAEVRASLSGQVALSATSIAGKQRLAVLNGRTYAEGEAIAGIDAPGPVVLAAVRPMSVRLRQGGTTVDVAFSRTSAATSSSRVVATPTPPLPPPSAKRRPPRTRARR